MIVMDTTEIRHSQVRGAYYLPKKSATIFQTFHTNQTTNTNKHKNLIYNSANHHLKMSKMSNIEDQLEKLLQENAPARTPRVHCGMPAYTSNQPVSLAELNIERELVEQYAKTKELMDEVLFDDETPANQKAQVANSVVTTLGQILKLQEEIQRGETLKLMEQVLIEVLKTLPQTAQEEFFAEYERLAEKAGLMH